jgi:drug/metabolite transporter (DMT)-like permease
MSGREKLKGHIFILLANVLFGINMPISKYLLPDLVQPESLTIMRILFACVMFWLTSLFMKKEDVPLKDIGLLFLCGMCGIAFNQSLFLWGLSQTSPVDASIIATSGPVFVMLLAALILKEPITKLKAFGVLTGATGGVLLILSSAYVSNQAGSPEGDLKIVASGLIYSVYVVISKPLCRRYSPVTIMKWMFLFSSVVLAPFMYQSMLDTAVFYRASVNWTEVSAIVYVLTGATFIPYLLIPMALKRIRPTTLSMYNYAQPVVASLIAVMVGQDTFSLSKIISSVLIFTGVYMVTQSKSREDVERELATPGDK